MHTVQYILYLAKKKTTNVGFLFLPSSFECSVFLRLRFAFDKLCIAEGTKKCCKGVYKVETCFKRAHSFMSLFKKEEHKGD